MYGTCFLVVLQQKKTIDEESLKPVDAPLAEGTATESLVPPPEVVDPVKP